MNFIDSTKAGLQNYANFKGRATRSGYWWFMLFYTLVLVVGSMVHEYGVFVPLLALALPVLAVTVRRLHDLDKSGWFYLLNLVPLGSFYVLFLCTQKGTEGANRF
jgi:uncharacterized membrane protein YhaH (DUF805 family)